MFATMSRGGRGAGLVLLGVVALLVAWCGGHRTRSASTGAITAGREQRRAHVDRSGPALSSIAGTIRDDANTPLLHVRVCARLTDGPTPCATADERGAYAIDNLVAGKYQIAAIADRHLPMRSDELVLGLGEHREGVDLVLPAGGVEITGTVVVPSRAPKFTRSRRRATRASRARRPTTAAGLTCGSRPEASKSTPTQTGT
jgi:hypothetical protein